MEVSGPPWSLFDGEIISPVVIQLSLHFRPFRHLEIAANNLNRDRYEYLSSAEIKITISKSVIAIKNHVL